MIIKTGIDIVSINRIERLCILYKQAFLKRILTDNEIISCTPKGAINYAKVAKRFAAKEAFSKMLGTGIGVHVSFKDIEISTTKFGAPIVIITPHIKDIIFQQFKLRNFDISLSLSDDASLVIASCILVGLTDKI